jgi:hypothetical protein
MAAKKESAKKKVTKKETTKKKRKTKNSWLFLPKKTFLILTHIFASPYPIVQTNVKPEM